MTSRYLLMEGCWNQVIFKASSNTNLFMMIKILLKQIKSEWYKGTFLNHTSHRQLY